MDRDVQAYMVFSWEEDRKMVLRIWSLVFGILATLMLLSTIGGRMAYVQGSYTGYIGFWTDCKRHKCASLGQVTVLIHMSQGFMILALALCVFLLPCMGLSFWSGFHRLNKIDAVFSSLSLSIGAVSHLNQAGIWSIGVLPKEWRISYRRWTVNCSSLHGSQQKGADMMLGHTQDLPDPGASQDSPSCNTLDLPDTDW
ncbi:PREDICTED: uncharacterized protein LOC102012479 isoform X3 [Chinchilla lanigera]|uniref:uncharacterized protein LOC102012479 isoform X3 n=1 Tax=Chinchilla lanigera TaxID=34839 RepID=UPI0006966633|nr:PREDICTED: uncharacterized protein LOC102012479 isoform X3 [Chinchilla lanigera]